MGAPGRGAEPPVEHFERLGDWVAGLPAWAALAVIVAATFVSEDLTCVGAGLLAARGDLTPGQAIGAAGLGIWLGDLWLYWMGYLFGRPALQRAPLSWMLHEDEVEASKHWFARRGPIVILLGRAVPGSRLPTYFAAGVLHVGFVRFALLALFAVALWAPLLGGASYLLGRRVLAWVEVYEHWALPALVGTVLALLVLAKFIAPLVSWKGRRQVVGRLRRIRNWEFWPPWVFYPPVLLYVLWLGLRHRGLTTFTAANPGIEDGGFIGESKSEILGAFGERPEVVRTLRLDAEATQAERVAEALAFLEREGLAYPVVVKPDAGQRGTDVRIVRDEEGLRGQLDLLRRDAVVQEYAPGEELGVFWLREPGSERGRIFSVTRKEFLELEGDGIRSIEELILDHPRAVCQARVYLEHQSAQLERIPRRGERVRLSEIGNHARGAVFRDGRELATTEMAAAFEALSEAFEGFRFGRYDVRVEDLDAFRAGRGFRVIELNGVTSEATHVYAPGTPLSEAYRVFFEQWRLAFEIGAENRRGGAPVTPWTRLLKRLFEYRRDARSRRRARRFSNREKGGKGPPSPA